MQFTQRLLNSLSRNHEEKDIKEFNRIKLNFSSSDRYEVEENGPNAFWVYLKDKGSLVPSFFVNLDLVNHSTITFFVNEHVQNNRTIV